MNIVYYMKFEFNYSFIVIYTTIYTIMIKKGGGRNEQKSLYCSSGIGTYDVHCPCGGCIQLG